MMILECARYEPTQISAFRRAARVFAGVGGPPKVTVSLKVLDLALPRGRQNPDRFGQIREARGARASECRRVAPDLRSSRPPFQG